MVGMVEVLDQYTHPDSMSYGPNLHWWEVLRFCLHINLCPHVVQLYSSFLQGYAATLEVGLLVEHPAVVGIYKNVINCKQCFVEIQSHHFQH